MGFTWAFMLSIFCFRNVVCQCWRNMFTKRGSPWWITFSNFKRPSLSFLTMDWSLQHQKIQYTCLLTCNLFFSTSSLSCWAYLYQQGEFATDRKQLSLVFTSKSHMGMPVFTVSTVHGSDLMTMNSFNSWLLWEVFILPSVLRDSFAAYSNGCWLLFSSRTWRRPFHALLLWGY